MAIVELSHHHCHTMKKNGMGMNLFCLAIWSHLWFAHNTSCRKVASSLLKKRRQSCVGFIRTWRVRASYRILMILFEIRHHVSTWSEERVGWALLYTWNGVDITIPWYSCNQIHFLIWVEEVVLSTCRMLEDSVIHYINYR